MIAALAAAALAGATPAAPAVPLDALIARAKDVMMQEPAQALALASQAETIARGRRGQAAQLDAARAEWLKGEALSRLNRPADALPVLDQALATVARVAPGDRLHGDLLLSRGWVREGQGAVAAALDDFQRAFELYRAAGESRGEAKALQNIAGIHQDAGDIARAQRYYAQAAETYHGDPAFALAAYNNVGESLRQLGRFKEAQAQYERALEAARQANSPLLQANILTNLAYTHLLGGDRAGAARLADQAFALSAHPAAADERPFVWGVLAQIAAAGGDRARAADLIGRAFAGVDLEQSALAFRDFHKLAAEVYQDVDEPALALRHLRAWKRLDDNVRAVAASTNAALMAARFDFSAQDLRIARLQASRAKLHETVLVIVAAAVSAVSVLLLVGIVSLRHSRDRTRAANRELSKALQVKSDFLAMTSHEIRTPLNGILGTTQVLLADRGLAGPLRRRIEVVHGAGETMRALVDDLLDLSKMESGHLAIERGPVRLHGLLEEAAALWRGRAEAKQLGFVLDLAGCPPLVEEDGDRLRQILFNLLANAVKFTERGEVRVKAAAENGRLVIAVSDTGIGIAPAQHAQIFEKFAQADVGTSRRFGGTGLGLAICRSLAEAMDGTVRVDSRLGEGATFTLDLPVRLLESPAPAVAVRRPRDEPRPLAEQEVLLLEPNALTQRAVAKGLREHLARLAAVGDEAALHDALAGGCFDQAVLRSDAFADGDALATALQACVDAGTRPLVLAGPDEAISVAAQVLVRPISAATLLGALSGSGMANQTLTEKAVAEA